MVAISFIILRKKSPKMARPFKLKGGTTLGWIATIMSIGIAFLYMPGMPSALIWPYEWIIILVWIVLGVIFYKTSMWKYGKENADKFMNQELDKVVEYKKQT